MREASPINFSTGCSMHLPVHAVYRVIHLWWRTMLGTTGASTEQHLTVMNNFAGISIHRYFSHICRTAVSVFELAVGLEHVLVALHCNNTRKLSPTFVNIYSREHPDALFLVTSRILMSIGRVLGVACLFLFMCPWCDPILSVMPLVLKYSSCPSSAGMLSQPGGLLSQCTGWLW